MGYKANFNGVELSQFCSVLNIKRDILPNRTNQSKTVPTMNGSYYTGFNYGNGKIEVEIGFDTNNIFEYNEKLRQLGKILNTKKPCKLILSDRPNEYCFAVIDGSTAVTKKTYTGTATLNFLCNDPLSYSNVWNTSVADATGIINISNQGSIATTPYIGAIFKNNACFFQVTAPSGETVLIGKPSSVTQPTISLNDIIVNDDCTTSDNFLSISNTLLDENRETNGNSGVGSIGQYGNAMVCTNYGSQDDNKWDGTAFKRNLGQNLEEFEVQIDFIFSSQGQNYVYPTPKPPTPIHPQGGLGTYRVKSKIGLNFRTGGGLNYLIQTAMPYGQEIYIEKAENGWGYGTYNGIKGWCYMYYLNKVSDGNSLGYAQMTEVLAVDDGSKDDSNLNNYAEAELGLLEIYGFDPNGAKLFKCQMVDDNQYYEYNKPSAYIGTDKVLFDDANAPSPRQVVVKGDNGNTNVNSASGTYGAWNDIDGSFIVTRTKNSDGMYLWTATILKYSNGEIVRRLTVPNQICGSQYPTGDLNYLGFYLGAYGKFKPVSVMAIKNVNVKQLNTQQITNLDVNISLFRAGDRVIIDFQKGQITNNGIDITEQLDVGSQFFDIPVGNSQLICISDDKSAEYTCGLQEVYY